MTSIGCVGVGAALPVGYRWAVGASAVGALLWGLTPAGTPLTPGSLEHLFLVFPLVIAPLGLWLASVLLDERGALALLVYPLARRLQPFAAALVLASFGLPKGALAGALTAGWLIVAVGISLGGARTAAQIAVGNRMRLNMVAAHVFLPIGAVWLLLSRLGIAPRGLSAQTVLLATLHFHFSGFALQILIVATGRVLDGASAYARLHRMVAVLAVLGIPLIAAGNLAHAPLLKLAGVACMVCSTLGLAVVLLHVAGRVPNAVAGALLRVSATSVALSMLLAGIYGATEVTGHARLSISTMLAVHGSLNAFGFTLLGLIGCLFMNSSKRTVGTP